MPKLEVRRRTGTIETISLDRRSPLTIGASSAADIRVDAEGVAPVECRLHWGGFGFVVTAVNPAGVSLNGTSVLNEALADADVLRIGDVDVVFRDTETSDPVPAPSGSAELKFKLDSADDVPAYKPKPAAPPPPASPPAGAPSRREPARPVAKSPPGKSEKGGRASGPESEPDAKKSSPKPAQASTPSRPARPPRAERVVDDDDADDSAGYGVAALPEAAPESAAVSAIIDQDLVPPERKPPMLIRGGSTSDEPAEKGPSLATRIRTVLRPPPRRPGEQELHRSPLVIGLTIGSLVLLLTAGTLWFVLGREFMQRKFDAAKQQFESGQYAQAIEGFDKFINEYPRHELAKQARVAGARARVEQSLSGAVPDWEAGLKTLNAFISQYRDTEDFQPADSLLRSFARSSADRIAMGAAETAKTSKKRPLLAVSAEARNLLDLLSPADDKPEDRLAAIAAAMRSAEAAILQHETFEAAMARMKEALTAGTPLVALQAYGQLVDRYAAARTDKPMQQQLKAALDAELAASTRAEPESRAVDPAAASAGELSLLSLSRRRRDRTDVAVSGMTTATIAEGAAFGVEAATGEPLWRHAVGPTSPFLPVRVQSTQPAWLLCDADRNELVCVTERTGEVLWRSGFSGRALGVPLVHEGQIFQATAEGRLLQFDLQTGEAVTSLQFGQPIVGPPAVSPAGDRMYIVGRESTLYVLSRRPLACEQAVYLGHGPGAVQTPLQVLRDYLLIIENMKVDRSRVRLFDASRDPRSPREIATAEIEGAVFDPPVVRGKQLVIASTGERLTAFVIAETGDQQSLTKTAAFQLPGGQQVPTYVFLGPDDQFWMSSTALRKFELKVDSIVPDKQQVAVGLTAQPLSSLGESLILGRRLPSSRAVLLASADRQRMSLDWQTALGASILEMTAPAEADGVSLVATALGDLFQVDSARLARGGLEFQPATSLPVDEKSTTPVGASRLPDGRVAVWSGGEAARLWIVSNDAAPREIKLDRPLQSAPARLSEGLVLPLPGKLRLVGRSAGAAPVKEWQAPVEASAAPAWRGVAAVDDRMLLALDAAGRLMQVQYRTQPVPHLAEVAHWDGEAAVDVPMTLVEDRAVVIDSQGRVRALDVQSLEPVGSFDLPRPAPAPAVAVGRQVLVDSGRESLVCFDVQPRLERRWELPLEGSSLVGAVLVDGKMVIARENGALIAVKPDSGEIVGQMRLRERLSFGPRVWGGRIVVGTLDGSLVALPLGEPSRMANLESRP